MYIYTHTYIHIYTYIYISDLPTCQGRNERELVRLRQAADEEKGEALERERTLCQVYNIYIYVCV